MIKLELQKRDIKGKKVRVLRRKGLVPGAIDMHKNLTINVQIKENELLPLVRSNKVEKLELHIEGEKEPIYAVVSEMVVNPLNNRIESFLFTQVVPESHVTVRVPIKTVGESPAVKNNIGVLVFSSRYVRLVVNSENIVPEIVLDISNLTDVGQRILIGDLDLPEGVKLASSKDAEQTVLTIRPPQKAIKVKAEIAEGEEGEEGAEGEADSQAESSEATETAEA